MMKNTEMKTACAEVRASAETNTPMPSDASTYGSVTISRAIQLPVGQRPKTAPAATVAISMSAKATPT